MKKSYYLWVDGAEPMVVVQRSTNTPAVVLFSSEEAARRHLERLGSSGRNPVLQRVTLDDIRGKVGLGGVPVRHYVVDPEGEIAFLLPL